MSADNMIVNLVQIQLHAQLHNQCLVVAQDRAQDSGFRDRVLAGLSV